MNHPLRPVLAALFLVTLIVRALTALTLEHAGYLDAFYYYHLALNMADGRGLTESVIWNYLDDPQQLPRPGNQYWMPLTNLWGWLGIATLGRALGPWRAAQAPFVVGSALLPPLAAWLAWHEWRRRDWAIGAGVLTIFSGFYFTYWVVTDSYTPFALAVALALLALWKARQRDKARWWALAGTGAGLSHLTRVDGALLVPVIALLLAWQHLRAAPRPDFRAFCRDAMLAAAGYLLLMGPWWARNWWVVGTPFPGGAQTLWIRHYNEIFTYDLELGVQRYLAWGPGPILGSKVRSALWSSFIVLGSTQFFLAPFILVTLRDAARRPLFKPFLLYTFTLLTAMPLLFTFPATRGSLLHSAAALLPWMMALAPAGITRIVRWLAQRRRTWNVAQATRVLGAGFVGLSVLITLYIYLAGVWLPPAANAINPPWNERTRLYEEVETWLASAGVTHDERIFVTDPPAYYVTTGRAALVTPTDGPATLARAAQDWDARWLLLDASYGGRSSNYQEMYEAAAPAAGWRPVATFTDSLGREAILFRFEGEGDGGEPTGFRNPSVLQHDG
ncbi:MAG: ArnT family glycosyltransferase [Ardenticatenaceae bacterium]